jgi:type I restriction enzyme, S subunit
MNNLPPYKTYKPSGIAWLGDIPEHWEKWKISRGVKNIGSGTTPSSGNKEYYENGTINWLNSGDFNDGVLLSCKKKVTQKAINENSALKVFPSGTLSIAMYGATIGKVCIIQFDATTNQACCNLEEGNILSNKFLMYWFIGNKPHIVNLSYGGGQPNISQDVIKSLIVPCPTKSEQTAIANFLDYKTAKIDRFIRKKKQLIKLLNEQKAGIINHAVTKGINPNVTTKPSGIEWLGDIPEHWEIVKLRYLARITTGNKNTEDKIDNGLYDFFVRSQKIEKINSYSFDGEGILTAGDGVGVGKVFHYINGKCDYHQRVYLFYNFSKSIFPKYLFYFLQKFLKNELMIFNAKSTVDSVRLPVLKDFLVALPSISEQAGIVKLIENETAKLSQTIATIEKEIVLVQEYRTALIAEAVTGKIDVRDYQIQSFEVADNYEEIEEALNLAAEDEVEYEKQDAE